MAWHLGPMCPFDLETTGVSMFDDRIVSYAVGRVGAGIGTAVRTAIVNPGIPIPPGATAIHGITDAMAYDGRPARDAIDTICGELLDAQLSGIPIVGWNVSYDLTMLRAECERHGLPTLQKRLGRAEGPVIDGLVLDKHLDPYRKGSRKLTAAAAHYDVQLSEIDAHGAEADAIAAARIVWRIATRYPAVRDASLHELHEAQTVWAREQADSLRAYFDSKGTAHDGCDPHWPIRQRSEVAA